MNRREAVIPAPIVRVAFELGKAGFEAYLVGGCVRDIFIGKEPKDWDITTNARPTDVLNTFEHAHYDNDYGTVRVVNDNVEDKRHEVVEVTTYRLEAEYSDGRRPDSVTFSDTLADDLKRRDFTVNALALPLWHDSAAEISHEMALSKDLVISNDVSRESVVDLFGGLSDLQRKAIRAVGEPLDRFNEDALRMMRAIRLAVELGFGIDEDTYSALKVSREKIQFVAVERIQEELTKLIMSPEPSRGLELSRETGLLKYILPELERGVGVEQNQAHDYHVWEHLLRSLQYTAHKDWSLEIRLAALLHDVAKPHTRRFDRSKQDFTFYGHEVVGARIARESLNRLKYPRHVVEKVEKLVRWHMFFSDPEEITHSAVRRLIRNVGKENVWDLMKVRVADRMGMGRPKEEPYRLRKYYSMIDEVMRDPVSVSSLALDGASIMEVTQETPGPRIGWILHALLEEVLEDPAKNTKEYLSSRTVELSRLSDEDLQQLGEQGKQRRDEKEEKEIEELRGKYGVE